MALKTPVRTLRLKVNPDRLEGRAAVAALERAARILRNGGAVAFPTETVYGLGANALNAAAVQRIFEAKQRPSWDPLIVHVASRNQLEKVVISVSKRAERLIEAFWPGPLTLLLPRGPNIPPIVTAGLDKVAVRMPSHPVARRLIEVAGLPLAAPSANLFGRTSPTTARAVLEDLDGRIDAVLDGGSTTLGLESTVLDVSQNPPVLYRPGMIPREQLEAVCGPIADSAGRRRKKSVPSPGLDAQHYAPRARVIPFKREELADKLRDLRKLDEAIGLMKPDAYLRGPAPRVDAVYPWGSWNDPMELARKFYAGLRELDRAGVSVILCPIPPEGGIGSTIRDRLFRAARPA